MSTPTKRSFLQAVLAASLTCSTSLVSAAETPRIGAPAPAFSTTDVNGKIVSLADFIGKTVVLEWTNPECPWVAKHYVSGNLQKLQSYATARGIVWLTVSSAGRGQTGYLDDIEAVALLDSRKAKPTHMLLDHGGRMLADYAVTAALTFAVVTPEGRLAYHGAIDDQPNARPEDVHKARNYVRDAIDAVAKGDQPSPSLTRAYGCTPN